MRDVNRVFEAAVRRDPANWFWVHNRWKQFAGKSPQSTVHGPQSTVHSPQATVQSLEPKVTRPKPGAAGEGG